MDGTIEETKKADPSNTHPSTVWNTLRAYLLLTLALSGGFALMDPYRHGQSIWEYLLRGAFIGAVIILARGQRSPKSRTYLPPGN
jgi:FtsH-binding integral membrane protein